MKCEPTLPSFVPFPPLTAALPPYSVSFRFHFSRQHRASTSDQEPLSRRLRLLVPQLLQAGGAASDLGRSSGGVRAGGRQLGQHRHELRPGLCGRSGSEWHGLLDWTQTEGGVVDPK